MLTTKSSTFGWNLGSCSKRIASSARSLFTFLQIRAADFRWRSLSCNSSTKKSESGTSEKSANFLICSPFPYYTGGRETWLFNVSRILAANGHEVNIFTYKDETLPQSFSIDHPRIHLHRMKTLFSVPYLNALIRGYLRLLAHVNFIITAALLLARILSPGSVVVAMSTMVEGLPIIILKKLLRKDVCLICSVRGFHADEMAARFPIFKRLWYLIEEFNFKHSDRIWCNGKDTLAYVTSKGYTAQLMPNGVNYERYSASSEKFESEPDSVHFDEGVRTIVSTATLLPVKGITELIDSLPDVGKNSERKFKVIWIGKGDSDRYRRYAEKVGCSQYIAFLGARKNTAPYLAKADIILCLSGGGGMSMALLEAMASGKPIVAWDNNVYRMLLTHNVSGILVEEKNSKALAESLSKIIDNYAEYKHLGPSAQKAVQEYDWPNIAARVAEVLYSYKRI